MSSTAHSNSNPQSPTGGLVLGGWTLTRLLATGRATRVFRARPSDRGGDWPEDYVVKTIQPDAPRTLASSLLRNEAQAARAVSNTHLATLLEANWDEPPYLVYPYLEGGSALSRLKTWGPAPAALAFWVVRQVITALSTLHRAGWAHGDLKPANIIVGGGNHATLIDLGFAHDFRRAEHLGKYVLATPAYAAPEVHRGARPTPSSDIYSLGATTYELLTGRKPFPGSSPGELADQHFSETPPDVRRHSPQLSFAASQLMRRMLAKDPAERPSLERIRQAVVSLEIETFSQRVATSQAS